MIDFVKFNRRIIESSEPCWPRGKPRTMTQRLVLCIVADAPRHPSDIATMTGLRRSTVSVVLGDLHRMNLIRFVPCQDDKRARLAHLSITGERSLGQAIRGACA